MTRDKRVLPASPERSSPPMPEVAKAWASLTWDGLEHWAGGRSVSRGQAYQRQGRVKDLAVSADGRLLATVLGGDRYVVSVRRPAKRRGSTSIESRCTCPVGYNGCKHAVATVAAFLQSLADKSPVPLAQPDDPRWARLAGEDTEDIADEDLDDDLADLDARAERTARRKGRTAGDWDRKIHEHIRGKGQEELADLVWSLAQRFPELQEEFRERISLAKGNVTQLLAQARRQVQDLTRQCGWRNSWTGEGGIPDYSGLKHRLERLVEKGHADQVVDLGRELLERGTRQVEASDDEGETAAALGDCMAVVFKAVAKSSLPGPKKILFAIDASLADEYSIADEAMQPLLAARWSTANWSTVADTLAERLKQLPSAGMDDWSRKYRRDRLSGWLLEAMERAGRSDERLAICEAEAPITGSYERLVRELLRRHRPEDAMRWAHEGIARTHNKLPGVADALVKCLCDMARRRGQWAVVAAHAAVEFLQSPSLRGFEGLLQAAAKAKCQKQVREAAIRFLTTGVSPVRPGPLGKPAAKVQTDADWPLPVPDYLVPLLRSRGSAVMRPARPHYSVLLEIALTERQPDEVLRWYDKMKPAQRGGGTWRRYAGPSHADRVAEAVSRSHPQRALEIYRKQLDQQLQHADVTAYDAAAATLRKMRPVLKALHREGEWKQLLEDIRTRYRNRPRFMEILDRSEHRVILESQRASAGRKKS